MLKPCYSPTMIIIKGKAHPKILYNHLESSTTIIIIQTVMSACLKIWKPNWSLSTCPIQNVDTIPFLFPLKKCPNLFFPFYRKVVVFVFKYTVHPTAKTNSFLPPFRQSKLGFLVNIVRFAENICLFVVILHCFDI